MYRNYGFLLQNSSPDKWLTAEHLAKLIKSNLVRDNDDGTKRITIQPFELLRLINTISMVVTPWNVLSTLAATALFANFPVHELLCRDVSASGASGLL